MTCRVVFLGPLLLKQSFGSAIPPLLIQIRSNRIATVVPYDSRWAESQLPVAFLEVPADVHIVARHAKTFVEATNLKQRSRMSMLYFHAEARQYAVIGTANKNEHAQGFFVKYGDGGADLQPIAHLFKTQVYLLARHLEVPEAIQKRTPTTDTYSAPCDQEECFFRLPFETLDLLWFAMENGVPAADAAKVMGLDTEQVQRVFDDITRKQRTTNFLRLQPPMLESAAASA